MSVDAVCVIYEQTRLKEAGLEIPADFFEVFENNLRNLKPFNVFVENRSG